MRPETSPRSAGARATVVAIAVLILSLATAAAAPVRTSRPAPTVPPPNPTVRSEQFYDQSRFDEAIGLLRDLVDSEALDVPARARALEILARCYVKKGYPVLAKDMFKELLEVNPGYRPDPVRVPPDEAALFERARKEFLADPEGARRTEARAARNADAGSTSIPVATTAPATARLELRVRPYASYYVDDTLRATNLATARIDLLPGEHRVRVVHPAFEPKEWKVRLSGGRPTKLDYDFPAASAGVVRVSTGGVWAEVYLDGRNTGRTTPCVLEGLSFGNHTVTVARAGFESRGGPQVVSVHPGETASASFVLHPTR